MDGSMKKKRRRRERRVAACHKHLVVRLLRNPRAQAAVSGLAFFAIFIVIGLQWVASINGLYRVLVGILAGFISVAILHFTQRFRKQCRFRKAVASALMTRLTAEELRRLVPEYATNGVSFTNFEKVEWLNKELGVVWPFLAEAMSYLLKENLQPILDDYRMGFVEHLTVRSLVLGQRSPQFGGARVLEGGDNEVTLEALFSWQCEKEEVLIDINTYGPNFSLKIKDIYISGTLKLLFKPLKEQLPGFGAIVVSLLEDPDMGFNIKVLGGDVKALPGVYEIIDSTIRTAVLDVLVWPSRYVYPVLAGDYSYLELRPVGILDVSLIEATDLMNTDILGKSDPFALLFVRLKTERIKRSSTKKNTLHPVWNEGFYIEVDDPYYQSLTIRLMDEETLEKAEYIGAAKFPLKELKPNEPKELWLDLVYNLKVSTPEKSRGKVHLLVIYKPYEEDQRQGGCNESASKSSGDDKKD